MNNLSIQLKEGEQLESDTITVKDPNKTTTQHTNQTDLWTAEERCFWQLESFRLLLCYHWMRKLRLFLLEFMRKDIWTLTNPWKGTPVSEYLLRWSIVSSIFFISYSVDGIVVVLFVLLSSSSIKHTTHNTKRNNRCTSSHRQCRNERSCEHHFLRRCAVTGNFGRERTLHGDRCDDRKWWSVLRHVAVGG